ncbi:hypothetical protein OH77DRAFT_1431361 [Trametes cingulata]|nr:hypothetical protein OH77DRAFT_1431361 [Trametes cingulata]
MAAAPSQSAEEVLRYVTQEMEWRNRALHAMIAEMSKLKQLQNSVMPVNSLPAEIFLEIFKHLRNSQGKIQDVVRVTHTCKLWRNIALEAPELWAAFPINRLDVITAFLQRSRARPLKLFLTNPQEHMHRIARRLEPHLHRVRVLRVRYPVNQRIETLFSRFTSPVPMLEELVVERAPRSLPPDLDRALVSLPELFGGFLPEQSLRKLHILNMCFLPRFSAPSVLVDLEIRQNFTADRILPVRDLIELLRQCPLLEKVRIAGIPLVGPANSPDFITPLPRLKRLSLFSSGRLVSEMLSHLHLPHTTRVRLKSQYFEPGIGYDMIPWGLESALPCLTGFKRLELVFDESRFVLRAFHSPDEYIEPALEISVIISCDDDVLFSDFLSDWPFDVSQVETLVLSGPSVECSDMLGPAIHELFRHLPNVNFMRVVSMSSFNATALVRCLSHDLGLRGPDDPEDDPGVPYTFLPKLTVLELCDIKGGRPLFVPVTQTVDLRRKGGRLREVNLSLVDGWDPDHAEAATIISRGAVRVTMDNGDE